VLYGVGSGSHGIARATGTIGVNCDPLAETVSRINRLPSSLQSCTSDAIAVNNHYRVCQHLASAVHELAKSDRFEW
jgi:hypothetical protein